MDVEQKVIEIIAEQALLDPSDVTPESKLDDLGLDSLGQVESIFAIEETFEISVPFNANTPDANDFDLSTVASIAAGIRRLLAEQP